MSYYRRVVVVSSLLLLVWQANGQYVELIATPPHVRSALVGVCGYTTSTTFGCLPLGCMWSNLSVSPSRVYAVYMSPDPSVPSMVDVQAAVLSAVEAYRDEVEVGVRLVRAQGLRDSYRGSGSQYDYMLSRGHYLHLDMPVTQVTGILDRAGVQYDVLHLAGPSYWSVGRAIRGCERPCSLFEPPCFPLPSYYVTTDSGGCRYLPPSSSCAGTIQIALHGDVYVVVPRGMTVPQGLLQYLMTGTYLHPVVPAGPLLPAYEWGTALGCSATSLCTRGSVYGSYYYGLQYPAPVVPTVWVQSDLLDDLVRYASSSTQTCTICDLLDDVSVEVSKPRLELVQDGVGLLSGSGDGEWVVEVWGTAVRLPHLSSFHRFLSRVIAASGSCVCNARVPPNEIMFSFAAPVISPEELDRVLDDTFGAPWLGATDGRIPVFVAPSPAYAFVGVDFCSLRLSVVRSGIYYGVMVLSTLMFFMKFARLFFSLNEVEPEL